MYDTLSLVSSSSNLNRVILLDFDIGQEINYAW